MDSNRRLWLKKIGIGVAGIGLTNFNSFASPLVSENVSTSFEKDGDLIFLRSNENPYGPSPLARKAFADNATISNRYNWDVATQLIADLELRHFERRAAVAGLAAAPLRRERMIPTEPNLQPLSSYGSHRLRI